MTRQFLPAITTLVLTTGFILIASDAVGQVTMQFPVTKDLQIPGFLSEQLNNRGIKSKIRPSKLDEDVGLFDFDTVAMEAFLDANPGNASWTLNIAPITDGTASPPPPAGSPDLTIMTVESTNDWAEGSDKIAQPLAWADGTPAATYFYAQTVPDGLSVDVVNSLEWIDPDSGPYTFTAAFPNYEGYELFDLPVGVGGGGANPTPEFTNSVNWDWVDLNTAYTNQDFASLAIDEVIIDAMINDENNRGLRFGPLVSLSGVGWRIYSKEWLEGILAPHLEVTITPVTSTPGDFDDDGDVDGNDFLVWQRDTSVGSLTDWQNNFGAVSASAAASAVPEPSTLLLLLVASSALSCIRCGNRQTV